MADLILKDIAKVFSDSKTKAKTVDDLSLEIKDEEFMVLIGPSGCGKSTVLRMIAGLEDITSGELYIGGKLVNDVEPKDRDIAMVFQNYALYPHMTVYENMAFALKLRKLDKHRIDEEVKNAARILGIEEFLDRKPKALSGGQRQRVALGRAIVRKPKVFLMDEPLSNLDAKLRVQTRAEIIKLHRKLKTTFIYVTHDQTEAMTMGDRIAIMNKGRIQQVDTPHEVYSNPVNMFVAGFIGSPQMNFIKGKLVEGADHLFFEKDGLQVRVDSDKQELLRARGYVGKDIVLGIRPEHIDIAEDVSDASVSAYLEVTELLGSEAYLHLCTGDETLVARIEVKGKSLNRGDVEICFDQGSMYFFDPETELTIR